MKHFILSLTLFTLIGSAGATVPSPEIKEQQARETIKASISYPAFAIEQSLEGVVWIRVQLLPNGHVEVIKASSSNNDLLRYTVDKIEALVFDTESYQTSEPFNLRFEFVLM
jgi:hypothetical protein